MGIQFNAKNILKVPQCLKIVELVRYFPFIILNQNQYIFAKLYIIFFSFYRCYPSFVCCLHELEMMEKIHCLLPQILMPGYQVDLSFTDIFSLQLSKLLVFCVVKSHQFWYSKYLTLQKHIFTKYLEMKKLTATYLSIFRMFCLLYVDFGFTLDMEPMVLQRQQIIQIQLAMKPRHLQLCVLSHLLPIWWTLYTE